MSLPSLIALRNRCIAVKPHFDFIHAIGNKILRRVSRVGNHFYFVVKRPLRIYAHEIICKNPLDYARVAVATDSAHWRSLSTM